MIYARSHGTTTFTLPEKSSWPLTAMARDARIIAPDGTQWTPPDEPGIALAEYVVPSWWGRFLGRRARWEVKWITPYGVEMLEPDRHFSERIEGEGRE